MANIWILAFNQNYDYIFTISTIVRCRDPETLNDAINFAISEEKIMEASRKRYNNPLSQGPPNKNNNSRPNYQFRDRYQNKPTSTYERAPNNVNLSSAQLLQPNDNMDCYLTYKLNILVTMNNMHMYYTSQPHNKRTRPEIATLNPIYSSAHSPSTASTSQADIGQSSPSELQYRPDSFDDINHMRVRFNIKSQEFQHQ
ncbi:unnamed protein product [Pieris macdunnoughi]|uniref:Uncharacterized protein n=1 Tax=Pieris macdunnoughi TaxID=345717 RepID=A0A821UJL6_9NEOP|nr:unnamed protein product [Pieris macdunnoughi]